MRIIKIVIFILIISSCAGFNEKALETIQTNIMTEKIDQYLSFYEDEKEFSGYVIISSQDNIIYQNGFGYADYENKRLNTNDTEYRIGSITKMMTSVAVIKCQEKGYLKLDDKVDKYIPEYNKGSQVTIRQLLSHTSGIPDWSITPWYYLNIGKTYDFKRVLDMINGQNLKYKPGDGWNYSNPNYVLAGEIIERVAGIPIEKFFKEELFTPLHMNHTGFGKNGEIPTEAIGYKSLSKKPVTPKKVDHEISYAAGNVYSSPSDMVKWLSALYSDQILNEDQKKDMFSPYGKLGENLFYGCGNFIESRVINNKKWNFISHSGGVTGFSCIVSLNEETGIMFIILGNYRNILDIYKEEAIEGDLAKIVFADL